MNQRKAPKQHHGKPEPDLARAEALSRGLFPHQIEGLAFLLGRRRAILADDMGLGKTRQAIVALREAVPAGPYLVVCPASVKHNWRREIHAVTPDAAVRIVGGPASLPPVPLPGGWLIVNYDILGKHFDRLEETPWAGIVFDEAHYLKNHTSQRSRFARRLADRRDARGADPVVYALTGTPLTNRPRDLFPLLQLVDHPLGKSFLSFARRYCAAEHNGYGWVTDGASNLEELAVQLHGVMIRRAKEQVLALPPKLRTWLPVEVPAGTGVHEVREALQLLLAPRAPQQRERVRLLALLTKARHKLAVAKTGQTIDLVGGAVAQGEKVLAFSCFDEPLQRLHAHFGDASVLLTGATPAGGRQALVDRFQGDDRVRVFVANILAGGVGLNLTAARQVVFNDLDWVPANHWQAEDRAYRIGQQGTVNVNYLVAAGTIDEFVATLLEAKAQLVRAVVEGQALGGAMNGDILRDLERLLGALSPRLADLPGGLDDATVEGLLRQLAERYRADSAAAGADRETAAQLPEGVIRSAVLALAEALRGPRSERYRAASSSRPGEFYVLTVASGDVSCTCPGFEYRGMCRHARDLKTALTAGHNLPAGFSAA
jgi:SWI/SNF-related matrix-associated actin-dependent regulator 1 of chromatin subfamily A